MTAEIWGTGRDQRSLRLPAKVFILSLTRAHRGVLTAAQISAGNLNKAVNASPSRGECIKTRII